MFCPDCGAEVERRERINKATGDGRLECPDCSWIESEDETPEPKGTP